MADERYVVAGSWVDHEWMRAAAARSTPGPEQARNMEIYANGPRSHPYGLQAFTVIVKGEPRIYPTRELALADADAARVIAAPQQPGFRAAVAEPGLPPPPETH